MERTTATPQDLSGTLRRAMPCRARRAGAALAWLPIAFLAAACQQKTAPRLQETLPLPDMVADGSTVSLQCGKTYSGTLDLRGKSGVTVVTAGTCGKAVLTPGRPVTGWTRYREHIYSVPVDFVPIQVAVSGMRLHLAHWPNRPWASSTRGMPDGELAGATLVYLDNQSVVRQRTLAGAGPGVDVGKPFYVEGKLWMLDSPGEWALHDGRLYVWTADGHSPEGRAWAAPDANGIDADRSRDVTVDGVRIVLARHGISADTATGLAVLHTDIADSASDGIWASGSRALRVDRSTVTHARRNGIDGWYWITDAVVTHTRVRNTGMGGMPTPSDGGIFFGDGERNRIENVEVLDSAYHGIGVLHNRKTSVRNSLVDRACIRLTDCGGIYTGARDRLPLDLVIEGNTVRNVGGAAGVGIYLDDFANGVTVRGNTISGNTRGLVLHNAFDTVVTHNTFSASGIVHLAFAQDTGRIRNNVVSHNAFITTGNEWTFNLEAGPNLKHFATIDANTYTTHNPDVFGRTWDGKSEGVTTSYSAWKAWLGQDRRSVVVEAAARAPGAARP